MSHRGYVGTVSRGEDGVVVYLMVPLTLVTVFDRVFGKGVLCSGSDGDGWR